MLVHPLQNIQTPERWTIRSKPQSLATPLVDLAGRRAGLLAFLLGLIGLKATSRLVVTNEEVNCETKSFTGRSIELIPLGNVADVHVAQYRAIARLVMGASLIFFGAPAALAASDISIRIASVLLILLGVALIAVFFLRPRLLIAVVSESGLAIAVVLEPATIGGKVFGLANLVEIQRTICQLVDFARSTALPEPSPVDEPDDAAEEPVYLINEQGFEAFSDAAPAEPEPAWQPPAFEIPQAAAPSAADVEQAARDLFDEAKRHAKIGDRDTAVELLRRLIHLYPQSTPADLAKKNLKKIGVNA